MELKKGQNLIEHEKEIYSRPARTWFQSAKDKLNTEGMPCVLPYVCLLFILLTSRTAAISKQQYEAGFDTERQKRQKKSSDENKVTLLLHWSY
jgi:ATP-dependent RNA helicase DDX27